MDRFIVVVHYHEGGSPVYYVVDTAASTPDVVHVALPYRLGTTDKSPYENALMVAAALNLDDPS
jgi:hypothetical protein